jgi:site-specific DNA recombinase
LKAKTHAEEETKELKLLMTRFEEFAKQITSKLENCEPEARREVVRAVIKRVEVNKERVRIVYRVDPMSPAKPKPPSSSQHCPQVCSTALCEFRLHQEM